MKFLLARYLPFAPTIPLLQVMSWEPTWKSLPTHCETLERFKVRLKPKIKGWTKIRSCFTSLSDELVQFLITFVHSQGEQFSQGCLWRPRIRYAFDPNNKLFTCPDLDWF